MSTKGAREQIRGSHQDEPIIIDNGPNATVMDFLPWSHETTLEPDGDDGWKIPGHSEHLYLWLNGFGPVKLMAGAPVVVEFWLGNTKKAGVLTIAWKKTAGVLGITTFKAVSETGTKLKWMKHQHPGSARWGLNGYQDADYRIKRVTYAPTEGKTVTWTNPATDLTAGNVDLSIQSKLS